MSVRKLVRVSVVHVCGHTEVHDMPEFKFNRAAQEREWLQSQKLKTCSECKARPPSGS